MSPREAVLQWYIWAGINLHYSFETVDNMGIDDFFDLVLLHDKLQNPKDYLTAEEIFHP